MHLGLALGDAGHPAGAIRVLQVLAERLAHEGYLLPAMVVILHGLHRAADDPHLLRTLEGLHVRGVRARAGQLVVPPPLQTCDTALPETATARSLLSLELNERLAKVAEVGSELPPAGPAAPPMPMPLFCELESAAFLATVRQLRYARVGPNTRILREGAPGDSLLILVSGRVAILKGDTEVAQIGAGSVLGEMALITNAPRSATAVAMEDVEYFELGRAEVGQLAKREPKVLQELVAYCRRRLILNLLRTSPLFAQFDESARGRLLERFQTVTFQAGQEIISRGQPASGLYVIASGSVQVQVPTDDGDTTVVASLGPGEVFGEISLLRGGGTTADVIAPDTVAALVLPVATFQQVAAEFPQVVQYLTTLTADRLRASADAALAMLDPDDLVVL
jgi:cAMP-dependent protein kinase regulator